MKSFQNSMQFYLVKYYILSGRFSTGTSPILQGIFLHIIETRYTVIVLFY